MYFIIKCDGVKMNMLDLCSGLGGAADGFEKAGFNTVTLDIEGKFNPDIVMDVTKFIDFASHYNDFDVIWASPPCTEFTKSSLPWYNKENIIPDMTIFSSCIKIIQKIKPTFWILENVQGARKFFKPFIGTPIKYGSRYLWGNLPICDIDISKCYGKYKMSPGPGRSAARSKIPIELSYPLAMAMKREI